MAAPDELASSTSTDFIQPCIRSGRCRYIVEHGGGGRLPFGHKMIMSSTSVPAPAKVDEPTEVVVIVVVVVVYYIIITISILLLILL